MSIDDDPLSGVQIARTSTVEQVAAGIRAAVLEGRLAPGTPLREHDLSSRMGVSRGTLREALRLLVSEGLVVHRAHRGAEVARLEDTEVADLYRARMLVECAALADFAASPDLVAAASAAVDAMAKSARADDVVRFVEAHASFHGAIVAGCGSERISRFAAGLEREMRLSLAVVERLTGSMRASANDHRALLEMLTGGDADLAERALMSHLRHGEADLAIVTRTTEG